VPIVKKGNGNYFAHFQQSEVSMSAEAEVREFTQKLRDIGFYPYVTDSEEMERLRGSRPEADLIFRSLILETVKRWVQLADERLAGSGIRFLFILGNDDDYFVDEALAQSRTMENVDGKVVRLDEQHEMLNLGASNETPWHTPRELSEDEIHLRLEGMAGTVEEMSSCIFNIHVPPFNSKIDECADLDENLRVITKVGHTQMKSAGSKAVRNAIEKYQPMLGLFGHIHESRGHIKLGRTLCINPGSNYTEGILSGALITLEKGKVREFQLTTG
jgi:Icc-related predicted phosphoesterase